MLRGVENAKIKCGHEHFEALREQVHYGVVSDYNSLVAQAEKLTAKNRMTKFYQSWSIGSGSSPAAAFR